MKILITGGLGHIGSKLIRCLPKNFKNCEITIIDKIYSKLNVESVTLLDNGINYDTYSLKCLDGKFYLLKVSLDPENIQLSRESFFLKQLKRIQILYLTQ